METVFRQLLISTQKECTHQLVVYAADNNIWGGSLHAKYKEKH